MTRRRKRTGRTRTQGKRTRKRKRKTRSSDTASSLTNSFHATASVQCSQFIPYNSQYIGHRSHSLFCNYIRAVHEILPQPKPDWIWTPGLVSLHAILIGTPPVRHNIIDAANVAPIFLLLNICSIYLGGLFVADKDDGFDVDWGWSETLLPEGI